MGGIIILIIVPTYAVNTTTHVLNRQFDFFINFKDVPPRPT